MALQVGYGGGAVGSNFTMCKEKAKTCKSCFTCAYKVLHQYSLNSTAYSELYTVYHFLLTLAITQVKCERSFSKLKLIKTRLRSSLSQENLESLILMSLETDILNRVSLDKVVDMLASTSTELKLCLRRKKHIERQKYKPGCFNIGCICCLLSN